MLFEYEQGETLEDSLKTSCWLPSCNLMVTIGLHVLWPSFFIFSKSDLVMLERFFGKEALMLDSADMVWYDP